MLRGRESAPLSTVSWHDLPHALRVLVITAVAIALYQTLGFIITMALLLFTLTFAAERRIPLARRGLQHRRRGADLSAVRRGAEDAARARPLRILAHGHGRQPAARVLGRAAARRAVVRLSRLSRRHHRRRAARHRAALGHQHSSAGDLRARHHQGRGDARRHLLRLAIRRLDHLDPDAHSGRGRLGDDLHRRLRHGAEGPRRRGALHRRGRLVDRRHLRRDHADPDRAAARRIRAALRAAGIHRAARARPHLPRLHVVDLAAAHAADGVRRAPARHHRHRQHDRAFPLFLRHRRARRRHRHRAGRGRAVRARRNPVDAVGHAVAQGDRARSCASCCRAARNGGNRRCRSRAARCSAF